MGVIECQLSVKFLTSQNFISRISAISPKKEKKTCAIAQSATTQTDFQLVFRQSETNAGKLRADS